ncbi:MAG: single-stranded DNA-binding protein [Actinomycetia bacterium]|nr:single-stranded DNA-binding protein [Actinomycetes bacterium]
MNEIFVTVNGTVGTDVQLTSGERSTRARFRLATAERYLDREANKWVERDTIWLDVICFRKLADHVAESVIKGQPVIVRGRLRVSRWESDNGPRETLEVLATSVGHDLAMGQASFARPPRTNREPSQTPAPAPTPTPDWAPDEPVPDAA